MADFRIDDLARSLLDHLPPAVRGMQQDLESNFRAVLRANLSRLDLVARDEFDAQAKLLERTRSRLEGLEKRLGELEALASGASNAVPSVPSGSSVPSGPAT